jgi:hypothetical protein
MNVAKASLDVDPMRTVSTPMDLTNAHVQEDSRETPPLDVFKCLACVQMERSVIETPSANMLARIDLGDVSTVVNH